MKRRSFKWVVLVGIAVAGVVAATAMAASAARTVASPFELVFTGSYEPFPECVANPGDPMCFDMQPATGTFTSGAPFCGSGTAEHVEYTQHLAAAGVVRRYTCADGSGTLTLSISDLWAEFTSGSSGQWAIVEGSGRYEGLRGKGTYTGELLGGNPMDVSTPLAFRTAARGIADDDTTPPSVAFTSASATKVRRHPGEYLVRVGLLLRDDVEGNPVAFSLKATDGPWDLDSTSGTTASGSVSTTLRILVGKRVRSVRLHVLASDPAGNEWLIVRSLKLPR